jgi:cell division protein FtsN
MMTSPATRRMVTEPSKGNRGYTWNGFLAGLLVGLAAAFGIALYVAKSQVFITNRAKVEDTPGQVSSASDAKPAWDPNTGLILGGKPRVVVSDVASTASAVDEIAKVATTFASLVVASAESISPASKMAVTMTYFVQVGAFLSSEDSQTQVAKLALLGLEGKTVEKLQANQKILYRVRVGPYGSPEEANQAKALLASRGFPDTVVIQVRP